jgi:large-conductance mechanosensitive channel
MAAPAALPGGLNFGPEVTYILAAVLILTGLALAFWGHGLWSTVMSMIGALLGSAVGFLFGAAFGGLIGGLILALVGAIIGSILFTKLVKVALAFLVGLLAAAVVYGLLGGQARFQEGHIDAALIGALLVLIVVFAISYYFIDDIIGIITAAIGGLLLALGLYLLSAGTATAGLAGLGVFILGALVQTSAIKKKKLARTRAAPTPPPPPPPPPAA